MKKINKIKLKLIKLVNYRLMINHQNKLLKMETNNNKHLLKLIRLNHKKMNNNNTKMAIIRKLIN